MNRFDQHVIDYAAKMNEGRNELTKDQKINRASHLLIRCLKRFDGCPNSRTTGLSDQPTSSNRDSLLFVVQRMYMAAVLGQ